MGRKDQTEKRRMTVTKRLLLLPLAFLYCAARALGRTMKIHKLAWALGFSAIALWAFTFDISHDVFELDGDAVTTSTHDWDQVYNDSKTTPPGNSSGAQVIGF